MNEVNRHWTLLSPLPLCDAETSQVESLESYFQRLAYVHGQPARRFLHFIDQQAARKSIWNTKIRSGLNGPGQLFLTRLTSLERMTNMSLCGATLFALNEVLHSRASGLTGTHRRWCPACLKAAEQHPATMPSDRLVWNFVHYARCSLHGVDIEGHCPHCGLEQPYGRSIPSRFRCLQCKHALWHAGQRRPTDHVSDWTNHMIEDLIGWTSMQQAAIVPSEHYERYIEAISTTTNLEILKQRAMSLYRAIRNLRKRNPSVRVLLNLAALQGVSVLDILLRPIESASRPLFARENEFDAIPFPPMSIPSSVVTVNNIIDALLHAGVPLLPPLILLCRRHHITVEHYAKYFERESAHFRAAFSRQGPQPAIGKFQLSRAFRIGLHLTTTEMDAEDALLNERLRELTHLPSSQARGVLLGCRVILNAEIDQLPNCDADSGGA